MGKKLKDFFIGLVDADLLDNGSRHPNLALLKIAGLLHDNGIRFNLITDAKADVSEYDLIYMSKVFSFTQEPSFYVNADENVKKKFRKGGTGYYVTETDINKFRKAREADMSQLSNDPFLGKLKNNYGLAARPRGIIMPRQMPYYDLYKNYVEQKIVPLEKVNVGLQG